MKSILISIQPQFVEKILNGEKTVEIRKTMPKCELPCKVYIYCTKAKNRFDTCVIHNKNKEKNDYSFCEIGNGKIVAEFTLNKVDEFHIPCEAKYLYDALNSKNENILKQSCLNIDELFKYLKDKYYGYAWHIDNLKIYNKPKQLNKFYKQEIKIYFDKLQMEYPHIDYRCYLENYKLQRPPQSWCYVEELRR